MGEIFKDPRKRAFLNPEGADRPLVSPLGPEVLARARGWRKRRLLEQLALADVAGILLYDPISIRYASDVSNMQVWATHNPFHYTIVFTGGHTIDFQYRGAEHLSWPTAPSTRHAPASSGSTAWPATGRRRMHGPGPPRWPTSSPPMATAIAGSPSTSSSPWATGRWRR